MHLSDELQIGDLLSPILIFQLLSLNSDLDEHTVTYFINQALNKSDYISSEESDDSNLSQIIIAIICLGFIYYPKNTLCIFNDKQTILNSSSSPSKMEKFLCLLQNNIFNMPYHNILLNKCIILGMCRLWLNYLNYLDEKENIKQRLFILISNIMINQKKRKNKCYSI